MSLDTKIKSTKGEDDNLRQNGGQYLSKESRPK